MGNSRKIVVDCGEAILSFDLLEPDERTASVLVGIEVRRVSSRQELVYRRRGVWIEYEQIDRFSLALRESGSGCLQDMSEYSVLQIEGTDHACRLRINPTSLRESVPAEELRIELTLDPRFPRQLSEAIEDFPRWW